MTLEEQYKEETGNESKYGEEIGIWGAAAGEYSKYYVAWLESTLTRVTEERDALIYAIESSLDVYTRPEIIAALDKIKEG